MLRARALAPLLGLLAVGFTCGLSAPAQAGIINTFDNASDTTGWYTDRYAPASFASGLSGGGRNGVLGLGINTADGPAGRPAAFSGTFYNTQGRKFDLAAGTTSLFVDLYMPTGFSGRLAGLWATAVNSGNAVSAYPILEANNGEFRAYNVITGAWIPIAGFNTTDQWYELGFALNGSQLDYFINGQQVASVLNNGSVGFADVILQGYNPPANANYTAYFDNLSTTTSTPEPATLATLGLLAVGVGLRYRRRKASAAGEPTAA